MLAVLLTSLLVAIIPPALPETKDTISGSVVTSSVKRSEAVLGVTSVSSLTMKRIEELGLTSPKDLSSLVPGLTMPDYGTSMTSTIYVRGLGSRMDNPVIGLYVDDVPVLDKNCYDFSFTDIRRADFMHGPQGTLYGRNSMLGVLSIETLSPDAYQGTRATIEYGSASTLSAKLSTYKGRFGFAAAYGHTNGFFINEYDGGACGLSDTFSARARFVGGVGNASLDNILTVSYIEQSGYPYRKWIPDTRELLPVDYNDKSGYRRFFLMDGFRLKTELRNWKLSSVTSLQALFDSMDMDQDFTPKSMFTLNQTQKQGALTQELIVKPNVHPDWWNSQTGLFVMMKLNRMSAPVRFLKDGIRSLILDNANSGMPQELGRLNIQEDNFFISSDFKIFFGNVAAYHESYFKVGRWMLTTGLRLDMESSRMRYDSGSDIHFIVAPAMSEYIPFCTKINGTETVRYARLQPKLSVSYDATSERMRSKGVDLSLLASVSEGYRSGGFNTQIFSDIMQNKMMSGMMERLGVHLDRLDELSGAMMTYRPEICLDYEIGGRICLDARGHRLGATVMAYRVDCRNQQMTVFPYGDGTGRMMANAGRSRSLGVEAEASWMWKGLSASLAGSLMDSRFVDFNDGREDWSGNRIPYSPESTLFLRCGYKFLTGGRFLRSVSLNADMNHSGRICWNEAGDISQPPCSLIGADVRLATSKAEFWLRGQNLTDMDYSVFYFKSVGNSFFQTGKPRRFTIGLSINL